eukprot:PLAT12284.1.p1 GENE.PLAT12284.1~~PLAT12284.1.p1  ORF type:complete len:806 (+),score=346.95 PLAT12284.1:33-2450(+)
MKRQLLCLFALAGAAAALFGSAPVSDFLYEHDKRFSMRQKIHVGLLGFNGNGGYGVSVDTVELLRRAEQMLRVRVPSCAESGLAGRLGVEVNLDYDFRHISNTFVERLESYVKGAMTEASSSTLQAKRVLTYDVPVRAVIGLLDAAYRNAFAARGARSSDEMPAAIIFINLRHTRLLPDNLPTDAQIRWRWQLDDGAYTQVFFAKLPYVVVDISSGPVQLGGMSAGEGTVSGQLLPRAVEMQAPEDWMQREDDLREAKMARVSADKRMEHMLLKMMGGSVPTDEDAEGEGDDDPLAGDVDEQAADDASWNSGDGDAAVVGELDFPDFNAKILSVILSAIRHFIVPDVAYHSVHFAEKVIVPLIVLRNHNNFDPLKPGARTSINVEGLRANIERMLLPGQELVFITGQHHLHDHPHIASALAKATKSDTVQQADRSGRYVPRSRPYIDAALLQRTMATAADALAAGLLEASSLTTNPLLIDADADGSLPSSFGSRVLPVYVFSLSGLPDDILFEGHVTHSQTERLALVLQTEQEALPLPYFSDGRQMVIDTRNVNRPLLAALTASLGGVLPPFHYYSPVHERLQTNYLWSAGYQPFGPFGNTSSLSSLLLRLVGRNAVFSRIHAGIQLVRDSVDELEDFAAEFTFDPLTEERGVQGSSGGRAWLQRMYKRAPKANTALLAPGALDRLHGALQQLSAEFAAVGTALEENKLAEASSLSAAALLHARAFSDDVARKLADARAELKCCSLQHRLKGATSRWSLLLWLSVLAAGLYLLVMLCLSPPQRRAVSSWIAGGGAKRTRQRTRLN